jgi:hypothetical protein
MANGLVRSFDQRQIPITSIPDFHVLTLALTQAYVPVPPSDLSSHLTTRQACRPVSAPPASILVRPCSTCVRLDTDTTAYHEGRH